ncbi:MAG: TadE/TadG family type IV pilus assembly protein [Acidobacteriaceae bacterium]
MQPRPSLRHPIHSTAGQALLEAALTLSVLSILLLGAAEFGRVAYAAIEVTRAAKAGVQYGDASTTTATDATGIANAAANEAPDIAGLNTSSSVSCSCANGGTSTCSNTDCPGSAIIVTLTVRTTATFDPGIHIPGLPATYTLHGLAVQQVLP